MSVCVFLGPSCPLSVARGILPGAHFNPPVKQGDVYAVANFYKPDSIALIDGYFQHQPTVWHKEILWALHQGIEVYGAASMGALRAAELHSFGMQGVGEIFAGYCRGALPPFDDLNDDDEVAVLHGPEETGYLNLSDALVNIRATLNAACQQDVLSERLARDLLDCAQGMHFSERRYDRLVEQIEKRHPGSEKLARFSHWVTAGRVDQKRADAEALLRQLQPAARVSALPTDRSVGAFVPTEFWARAVPEMQDRQALLSPRAALHEQVVDQLRQQPNLYRQIKLEALASREAKHPENEAADIEPGSCNNIQHRGSDQIDRRELSDQLRRQHGLWDRTSIDSWLARSDMAVADYDALIDQELTLRRRMSLPDTPSLVLAMVQRLKRHGRYAELAEAAEATHRAASSNEPMAS